MRISVYVYVCLLLSFFVTACNRQEPEKTRPVRAKVVGIQSHGSSELITGQISAHAYVNASFRTPGKLSKRLVSVGDTVKAGQLLAILDDTVQKNSLNAANAEVAAARAYRDQAESLEKRAGILLQSKALSQNEYDEALRQLKSSRAQVQAAEAKSNIAKEQLDYTQLKAETDGVVVDKLTEVGEVVGAGQPVIRIAADKARDAVFDMPEDLLRNGLTLGQKIEVCLDRDRNVCVSATICEIAPDSDARTRTYRTKAILDNNSGQMLLGATVVGRLALNDASLIHIPASSLTKKEGKPAVWLIKSPDNSISIQTVEIAGYTTDEVILQKGLNPGDQIVTAGVQALHQGQKVRPMENEHAGD